MSDGSTAAVAVTWSATGGTVSTSGLYKAGTTAGSYRVIAVQQGGTKADTSAITVTTTALSSVVLTPATATVAAGATQQLTAQGKMSDGSTAAVAVTWSATGGTVSTSGLYKAGTTAGSYRVIAVQQGGTKADTSAITVTTTATAPTPPPASGRRAGPDAVADGDGAGAERECVHGVERAGDGGGGLVPGPGDERAGVEGDERQRARGEPGGASRLCGWGGAGEPGVGGGGNSHTLLVYLDNVGFYLVDFTRGVGLSNWRQPAAGPSGDLAFTFSNNPATPQIAYVYTGSQLVRLNTATNQVQNTGNFPKSGGGGWLQQDKNDAWFVYTSGPDQVTAWNSQTNQTLTRTFASLDEPRLERDGRYAAVIAGSGVYGWDLQTNTLTAVMPRSAAPFFHAASARRYFYSFNSDLSAPWQDYRLDFSSGSPVRTQFGPSVGVYVHGAGQWIQDDASVGGDLTKQWVVLSTYNRGPSVPQSDWIPIRRRA